MAPAHHAPLEDPLDYLPFSRILEYGRGQVIYSQNQPSVSIYLVIGGRVKVSRLTDSGRQILVDIYQTDDFFGESALLGLPRSPDQATAMENTKLMTWVASEVEEVVTRRPRLGVAFLQMLAERTTEFKRRIVSLGTDSIARSLARCLISFSERMGTPLEDGSVSLIPFTHELLSEHIGTSREIVTHYMIQFRGQDYLRYSRKAIVLYPEALREWLRHAS
jgi:CRP/FNR family transcriptional regulator